MNKTGQSCVEKLGCAEIAFFLILYYRKSRAGQLAALEALVCFGFLASAVNSRPKFLSCHRWNPILLHILYVSDLHPDCLFVNK